MKVRLKEKTNKRKNELGIHTTERKEGLNEGIGGGKCGGLKKREHK
jgi:hypothetical protein